jgi:hypothetical protein
METLTNYIYLLQEREFVNINSNIFKVGMTTKLNHERFNQYPKGSKLLFQIICNDCKNIEKIILKKFREKFNQQLDIGNEYFEGDYKIMIDDIYSIVKNNNEEEQLKIKQLEEEFKQKYIEKESELKQKLLEKQLIEEEELKRKHIDEEISLKQQLIKYIEESKQTQIKSIIKQKQIDEYFNKYDFTKSIILSCFINDIETEKKYKPILVYIYKLINHASKIKEKTTLNIVNGKKTDKGFVYLDDLDISIQGVDSNKCLYEILNQCNQNKINIKLQIKTNDNQIIIL